MEQFIGQSTDFGGTDAYLTDDELADAADARGCDPLHIPTVVGAVAPAFNVEGLDELVLDGSTLAGTFVGEITHFGDDAIAELNPDAELPDQEITVVHRSDGSGTHLVAGGRGATTRGDGGRAGGRGRRSRSFVMSSHDAMLAARDEREVNAPCPVMDIRGGKVNSR